MEIFTLSRISNIDKLNATVEMKSETDVVITKISRKECFLGKKYVIINGKWKRISKYRITINNITTRREESGYTVASVNITKNFYKDNIPTDTPKIKGFFGIIYNEEEIECYGFWNSTQYGIFFEVVSYERVVKIDYVSVKNYIRSAIPNISQNLIEKLIKEFGVENVISTIKENPDELKKIKGVGNKTITKIINGIGQSKALEDLFSFLSSFDIPTTTTSKIYKKYGLNAESITSENPYILVEDEIFEINMADKIAIYMGKEYNSPERVRALISNFLKDEARNKGDMFTTLDFLVENLNEYSFKKGLFLRNNKSFSKKDISDAIESLKNDGLVFIENHPVDGICIYNAHYKRVEDKICNRVYELVSGINTRRYIPSKVNECLDSLEKETGLKMDKTQKEAVHMAIKSKFSILTGGPGTGKTQTINAIIKSLNYCYPEIEIGLCAPTGKASKRMSEMTGMTALTVHKKLKCTPYTSIDELDEISSDFLIIDEASMIDADLFYKLVTLTKDDCSILFVGDYHQLPSVGVGLILRDLIESQTIPVTTLTKVFRQNGKSSIIDIARDVASGKTIAENSKYIRKKSDVHINIRNNNADIQDNIIETIKKAIDSKVVKESEIQILMPVNHGDIGMVILNQKIQEILNPDRGQEKIELTPFMELREGDRVMQTKNNYKIGVVNGSVGYIKKITYCDGVEVICEFDGEEKRYTEEEEIEELVLAYAITIHKSQGSEFPLVIMPVSKSYYRILSRNLIYTAITRAKKYLRIIGDLDALNDGINNTDINSRNSHIRERLQNMLPQAA